jgi:alpha-glucosidase (family GH31 glycosyl hydrolase)
MQTRNGTFAGGDHFTTYTAIPSYISTSGNVFYLDTESTALAYFDFTVSDKVTVRYDALHVTGAFLGATDMFEAVERLTEYTGRMPSLPSWVDNGAILGIQGGQDKVNQIVQHGLELNCPIAAVWLQDWSGTRRSCLPH